MSKLKLNENEIVAIVYNATKKMLSEGLFRRTRPEGKPQKASDVIKGNGWKAVTADKGPNFLVLRCYKSNDAVFAVDESLPFEELVEDLNIYYQDKGVRTRAEGMEEYNGQAGCFIKVSK